MQPSEALRSCAGVAKCTVRFFVGDAEPFADIRQSDQLVRRLYTPTCDASGLVR